MHVVIFEGADWSNFAPISLSRPTFTLPCGMVNLLSRQIDLLRPKRLSLWVRQEMVEYCRREVLPTLPIPATINEPLNDEPAILTSARVLDQTPAARGVVADDHGNIHIASVDRMAGLNWHDVFNRSDRWQSLLGQPRATPSNRIVHFLWQLLGWNEELLNQDFARLSSLEQASAEGPWHLIQPQKIRLAKDAKLSPGCVLDASKGPIVLDEGASIGANAVVQGPCYIGKQSTIHPLALIRGGTSIGAMCRIGGEVSNAIICSYTNKAHDGFVGDSYLGSWVNLGAGTTTSNLKNTYGEITLRIGSKEYKTGRRMLGSLIGDHTKTAIGTRLNTGSYIGYNCLLAGNGLAPTFIPSFTFWTADRTEKYDLPKAADVASKVMQRRDKQWTPTDQAIQQYVANVAVEIEK